MTFRIKFCWTSKILQSINFFEIILPPSGVSHDEWNNLWQQSDVAWICLKIEFCDFHSQRLNCIKYSSFKTPRLDIKSINRLSSKKYRRDTNSETWISKIGNEIFFFEESRDPENPFSEVIIFRKFKLLSIIIYHISRFIKRGT